MTTMNARLASLAVAVVLGALGVLLVATWQPSDPVLVLLALVTGVAASAVGPAPAKARTAVSASSNVVTAWRSSS